MEGLNRRKHLGLALGSAMTASLPEAIAHAMQAGVTVAFAAGELGVRVEVRGLPGSPIVVDALSMFGALERALEHAHARVKHEAV